MTNAFHELLEFMTGHFAHEETLMDCLTPEAARRHREEHANISGRMVQFIGRPGRPAHFAIDANEFAAIVASWLENHIRYWDMPLASLIQSQGRASGGKGTTAPPPVNRSAGSPR